MLKLAFLIYRYFPYGGQQRNMLAMAQEAHRRGHQVKILCHHWQGDRPDGLEVVQLGVRGFGNHTRMKRFGEAAQRYLENPDCKNHVVDLRVGFIKLPGLDAYYAADPCFAEKAKHKRGFWYRLAPRTKGYLALEAAVFAASSPTHILEVSRPERESYMRHYGTQAERFHTLIPGIARTRLAPDNYVEVRADKRRELGLNPDDRVLLALGSGFKTKGLDRSISALAELRRRHYPAQLLVVGQDNADRFQRQARELDVESCVHFLGGRDDIPALLQAADVLIHPAYRENTGNGLLEAMIAGLPVVATATCGYSHYVADADMGAVIADTADTGTIASAVEALWRIDNAEWHRRGKAFADTADIYDRPRQCVDILEQLAART